MDALSETSFSENIGADNLTVFNGPVSLTTLNTGNPKAFDLVLTFSTPFLYDPAAGNLLVDFQNLSGASPGSQPITLDFHLVYGDAFSTSGNNFSGASDVVAFTDTTGLVTRFTTIATPEPASAMTRIFVATLMLIRRGSGLPAR